MLELSAAVGENLSFLFSQEVPQSHHKLNFNGLKTIQPNCLRAALPLFQTIFRGR